MRDQATKLIFSGVYRRAAVINVGVGARNETVSSRSPPTPTHPRSDRLALRLAVAHRCGRGTAHEWRRDVAHPCVARRVDAVMRRCLPSDSHKGIAEQRPQSRPSRPARLLRPGFVGSSEREAAEPHVPVRTGSAVWHRLHPALRRQVYGLRHGARRAVIRAADAARHPQRHAARRPNPVRTIFS